MLTEADVKNIIFDESVKRMEDRASRGDPSADEEKHVQKEVGIN